MKWQDVNRIVQKHSYLTFVCWPAIAKELTELAAQEQKPEKHWAQMTWEEREERIRAICQEEIQKDVWRDYENAKTSHGL